MGFNRIELFVAIAPGAMENDHMLPWNHWYHCTTHTYGSWLRGDPRGWRARHHREHVQGDYKKPPPSGKYDALFNYSKSLMKRDPVRIVRELRQFVVDAIVARLIERNIERNIETRIVSLDSNHLHVLIRCPDRDPRIVLGISKQYATAQLKAHGLAVGLNLQEGQGLWAKRSHPEPIKDAQHFRKATDYIRDHASRGAIIWEPDPICDFIEIARTL